MRLLKRNMTEFEYYGYTGVDSDVDAETGLHTGVPMPLYSDPVTYKGNISAPSGSVVQAFDGLEIQYTHILLMDDTKADIHEEGYIKWRGNKYDITGVRPSLNVLSVALRQRLNDYGDQREEPDEQEESEEPEGEG